MTVSVYLCKIACNRPFFSCKSKLRMTLDGVEVRSEHREEYLRLKDEIAAIVNDDKSDPYQAFDRASLKVNYNDLEHGVVSFSVKDWLVSYLESDACVSSPTDRSAIAATAFQVVSDLCAIIAQSRQAHVRGADVLSVNDLFGQLHSFLSKATNPYSVWQNGSTRWERPADPRNLSYLDLIAHAFAACAEEIGACQDISDQVAREERVTHHVALAVDMIQVLWRTFESYACEAPPPPEHLEAVNS